MKKRSLSDCQHVTESFLIENMDEMIAAAREGRLLLMPKEHKQPQREDVLNSVRAYVSEIECFARRGWDGRVKDVWETIFKDEVFYNMLLPGSKTRKFREFNKYGVMRIVGMLRSFGVYDECINDSQLCKALERTSKDSSYRSYIGLGFDSRENRQALQRILYNIG